jgi:transcriptional regulator with XRE-family HTH domain/quercetin dioxygenase-like cupin family protein
MAASEVPWLGARLREERVRRGVSLRGLAREVGVSASMISQIETAKTQPSVSTLYAITTALGISVEGLFAPPAPDPPAGGVGPAAAPAAGIPAPLAAAVAAAAARTGAAVAARTDPGTGREALRSIRGGRLGPLVRPDDRRVLSLDSGVTWELLGEVPHRPVDFLRVTYAPGGTSSSSGGLMRHPGSEYGFLSSGRLLLTLGFEEIELHPGDAVSFDSTTPHAYRNDGTEPAVGVWFVEERDR